MYTLLLVLAVVGGEPAEKPRFIVLSASWCPPCEHMRTVVIPAVAKAGGMSHVDYYRIDVDKYPAFAAKYMRMTKSRQIPQLMLFVKFDGKWFCRYHIGGMEAEELKELLTVRRK